jgi:hypothetical protein
MSVAERLAVLGIIVSLLASYLFGPNIGWICAFLTILVLLVCHVDWFQRWVRRLWILAWGLDLDEGFGEETGISESLIVFGLIISQGVALTLARRDTDQDRFVSIGLYMFIALFTLGAGTGILRAHDTKEEKRKHTFNRGTVLFTRFTLATSILLSTAFSVLALLNLLPDHERKATLVVDGFAPYQFQYDKDKNVLGVEFYAYLYADTFRDLGYATRMNLRVAVSQSINEHYRISNVKGFTRTTLSSTDAPDGPPQEQLMDPQPTRVLSEPYDEGKTSSMVVLLRNLNPASSCRLRFLLHPRKVNEYSNATLRDEVLANLKEKKHIEIESRLPK